MRWGWYKMNYKYNNLINYLKELGSVAVAFLEV